MRDVNSSTPNGQQDADPSLAEPGSVHVLVGSQKIRIVLSGEVDAELGPDLTEAASDAENSGLPIEIDLRQVSFMDSTGVAFLARLASRSQPRVKLIKPPEVVLFLLSVTRIGDILDVVDEDPGIDETLPRGVISIPPKNLPDITA